jgi:hypothetical protein
MVVVEQLPAKRRHAPCRWWSFIYPALFAPWQRPDRMPYVCVCVYACVRVCASLAAQCNPYADCQFAQQAGGMSATDEAGRRNPRRLLLSLSIRPGQEGRRYEGEVVSDLRHARARVVVVDDVKAV